MAVNGVRDPSDAIAGPEPSAVGLPLLLDHTHPVQGYYAQSLSRITWIDGLMVVGIDGEFLFREYPGQPSAARDAYRMVVFTGVGGYLLQVLDQPATVADSHQLVAGTDTQDGQSLRDRSRQ